MTKLNELTAKTLDIDTLNELRMESRIFQKLDLMYLVAGGTIITALKINNYELPEVVSGLWFVVITFLCLTFIDYTIYSVIFFDWIASKTENPKRKPASLLAGLVNLQLFLHFLFIGLLISYAFGHSIGMTEVRNHLRAHAFVQDQVDYFILKEGRVPATVEELVQFSSSAYSKNKLVKQLAEELFLIDAMDAKKYRLIFAGEDKKLGTSDDVIEISDIKLQILLDRIRDEEISNKSPAK